MSASPYAPMFELTRGRIVESIHNGAVAVVDVHGNLLAHFGDPYAVTFLRSAAKPFQALPFVTHGGVDYFQLTPRETALICASHSGTDEHVAVVTALQRKVGVDEADLLCGVHEPYHAPTAQALRDRHEMLTPNRHNCSGKHTGMLAYVQMLRQQGQHTPGEGLEYIDPQHPIQREIVQTFAEMCALPLEKVELGIDGCSAPNFAAPLYHAALAYARLADPEADGEMTAERAAACRTITSAMMFNADMVGGPARFDTRLMEVAGGRILIKAGAEGYQGICLMPGALGADSPAVGIALKIGDGDLRQQARPAVVLEILRQLGVLSSTELGFLSEYGPVFPVENWRKLEVGQARPSFQLERDR